MDIQKVNKNIGLFDFYTNLLTNKQRHAFTLYYFDDLSLGEIAQELGTSRQAVYDIIKRTEKLLNAYEQKMQLYHKFLEDLQIIEEIKDNLETSELQTYKRTKIIQLLEQLISK